MKLTTRRVRRYPELALFPDEEDAARSLRQAAGEAWLSAFASFILLALPMLLAGNWVLEPVLYPILRPSLRLSGWIGLVPLIILAAVLVRRIPRRIRFNLRKALIYSLIPVCLTCGYSLRGLQPGICPECGAAWDPRLLDQRGNPIR